MTSLSLLTGRTVCSISGLFGNILTLIVTTGRTYRNSAHGLYITAMAVADIVFLITQPFNRSFASYLFGWDVRTYSLTVCKMYYFFLRWARPMSSLVIVLICVERFVAIWFPLHAKAFSNKRAAYVQIAVVFVLSTSVSAFRTLSVGIEDNVCLAVVIVHNDERLVHICSILGMTIRTLIPTLTLLILTPPTVGKLFCQRRIRREMSKGNKKNSDETFHVSIMLLSVAVAFCILITPLCLTKHGYLFMGTNIVSTSSDWMQNVNEIRLICEQLNCVINFILYVLLSRTFRSQFYAILTCRRNEKNKWQSSTRSSNPECVTTLTSTVSKDELKY